MTSVFDGRTIPSVAPTSYVAKPVFGIGGSGRSLRARRERQGQGGEQEKRQHLAEPAATGNSRRSRLVEAQRADRGVAVR